MNCSPPRDQDVCGAVVSVCVQDRVESWTLSLPFLFQIQKRVDLQVPSEAVDLVRWEPRQQSSLM